MTDVTNYLNPAAIAQYELRSRQANLAANRGLAKLTTRKQYALSDFNTGRSEMQRQYGEAYRRLPSGFARRGLLRSGMYKTARENQQMNFQRALADFEKNYNRQMAGFGEQQGDIELIRGMTLDQILSERAAANAELAARLREA